MALLTDVELTSALAALPGWERRGDALSKQFTCASFPDAVAALVRLAFWAEGADHHPDLTMSYRRVTVSWSTHSEGGVTARDVEGARETERVFGGREV